jgi:RNA polymerase sigma-70 factor (sigma-E family)
VDDDGFEAFARARLPALVRYGTVLAGNPHDGADLAQEALVRVSTRWARVGGGNPEAYVRRSMARLHVSFWRRIRRERLAGAPPDTGYLDDGIARADGDVGLARALRDLPAKYRVVLVLRYYEDLPDAEIAELLGISRPTVRTRTARALERLRAAETVPVDGITVEGRLA